MREYLRLWDNQSLRYIRVRKIKGGRRRGIKILRLRDGNLSLRNYAEVKRGREGVFLRLSDVQLSLRYSF